uniref:Uncharacterized protein n=1 Tax=Amphimedon queenslandica TaxID=400682 RepID=A0A1X7UTD6_AMPQE
MSLSIFQKLPPQVRCTQTTSSTTSTTTSITSTSTATGSSAQSASGTDHVDSDLSDDNDSECDDLTPAARHPALDYNDIANVAGNADKLSSSAKYDILRHHFKPNRNHTFPRNSNGCSFQYNWLQDFPWLAYSLQQNGGYCINCVLLFCISGY